MNKSILITGAGSGMGLAFAQIFSENGYQVFATCRTVDDIEKLSRFDNVHPIRMDVTIDIDIKNAYDEISEMLDGKGLHSIINNAGITYTAPFEFAEEAKGRYVLDVNLMAPVRITKTFLPLLLEYNSLNKIKARVINIASWAGYMGQPFIGFYNASKAALIALSESMYYDLGLLDVHVVLAVPGMTNTPLIEKSVIDNEAKSAASTSIRNQVYKALFEHYGTLSGRSINSRFLASPGAIASKVYKIAEVKNPNYKYNLTFDAILVDKFLKRVIPFRWLAALNRKIYNISKK